MNLIGGIAVLGSYFLCMYLYPEFKEAFWGGIYGNTRNIFLASMVPAAIGYLAFLYCVLLKQGLGILEYEGVFGGLTLVIFCVCFLVASSILMPALVMFLKTGSDLWWSVVVTVLWITSVSLACMLFVVVFSVGEGVIYRRIASYGLAYIMLHCFVFDATIWVLNFQSELHIV